jgi:hypothetical protein
VRPLASIRLNNGNRELGVYVQESRALDSLVKNPLDWISRSRSAGDRLARTKSRFGAVTDAELIGVSFPLVCCWLDGSTAPEKENWENLWLFLEREKLLIKKELTFLDFGQV